MSEPDFSPLYPKYHEAIDDWGLSKGTRIWMGSGSFQPVETVEAGDYVFGVTFQLEDVALGEDKNGREQLAKAWRPRLSAREVLGVRTVQARSWQMTFGDAEAQYESRRLVAGGDTKVDVFPVDNLIRNAKRLVETPTAVENPRVDTEKREAKRLDPEWSKEAGERKYRPTEFTGMPRGELVAIIPYEAYGGQIGLFNTQVRPYNRYCFSQVHEIVPLQEEATLYQVYVQPDTKEKFGVHKQQTPRANLIAQTPFAKENRRTKIIADPNSRALDGIEGHGSREDFEQQWDEYAKSMGQAQVSGGTEESYESESQGVFHQTRADDETAKSLKENYGIEGGFLNGGILLSTPLPPNFPPQNR